MHYYPIFLNLEGKPCLVIGGGKVAERKIISLLKAKADVTVVSPRITVRLKKLKDKGRIRHIKERYKKSHLNKVFLVVAATNDPTVNTKIYRDAQKKNILINSANSLKESNFIVPASLSKQKLSIAISTQGEAPSLAKQLKHDIAKIINKDYIERLKVLSRIRKKIKNSHFPTKKYLLNKLAKLPIKELKKHPLAKI